MITIYFICFIFLTIPQVFAQINRINVIPSKEKIEKGEEIELSVQIENTEIASMTLQIYFDMTKLEYVDKKTENSHLSNNRILYTWTDSLGGKGKRETSKVQTFLFKGLEDGMASIVVTGEFYDKEGNNVELEDGIASIQIGSENKVEENIDNTNNSDDFEENTEPNNANLRVMRLNEEGISPVFQKNITDYYFIAKDTLESLEVTAIPENKNAKVSITGNRNLKQGENTIQIKVESEDKTNTKVYTIHVTKTSNPELANTNLETLAVREGSLYPPFDASITKYYLEVANNIKNIEVLAIPQKMEAKVEVQKPNELQIGRNKVGVIVTAENGSTHKQYVIDVYRRSEQEDVKAKEEQEKGTEQLMAILQNEGKEEDKRKEIETKANKQNEEDKKKENTNNLITFGLLGIIIVGFVIGVIVARKRKNKEKN